MTKRDQRRWIGAYGAAKLTRNSLTLLKELVTVNFSVRGDPYGDAEEHFFKVGMGKLSNRTGLGELAIERNLTKLVEAGLLTIVRETGKTNQYKLHLTPMKKWPTAAEARKQRLQERTMKKLQWKKAKREKELAAAKAEGAVDGAGMATDIGIQVIRGLAMLAYARDAVCAEQAVEATPAPEMAAAV